jgi:hypothetical protein
MERKNANNPGAREADKKAERLKAALKANLQKRKMQARTRKTEQSGPDTDRKNES